jgi:transcriptional regulator with GAF, ATPase, and Fis domain
LTDGASRKSVIAATNKDLRHQVEARQFGADVFYWGFR